MSEQQRQNSKKSEWHEDALAVNNSSFLGKVIFVLLLAISIFAVIIFGAVDVWRLVCYRRSSP
jgi:hypothetical protein